MKNKEPDYKEEYLKLKRRNYEYVMKWQRKNPRHVILYSAKQRAAKRNVPFSLTVEDIEIPEVCPILGIQLEFSRDLRGRKKNSPSLDRIDHTKGYESGNVRIISDLANRMKTDATHEELVLFAKAVLEGKV